MSAKVDSYDLVNGYLIRFSDPNELVRHMKDNYLLWLQFFSNSGIELKSRGDLSSSSSPFKETPMLKAMEKEFKPLNPRSTTNAAEYRQRLAKLKRLASSATGAEKDRIERLVAWAELAGRGVTTVTVKNLNGKSQQGGGFLFNSLLANIIFLAALFFAGLSSHETFHGEVGPSLSIGDALLQQIPGVPFIGGIFSSATEGYVRWRARKTRIPAGVEKDFVRVPLVESVRKLDSALEALQKAAAEYPSAEEYGERARVVGANGKPIDLSDIFRPANRNAYISELRRDIANATKTIEEKGKEVDRLNQELADLNDMGKQASKAKSGKPINRNAQRRDIGTAIRQREEEISQARGNLGKLENERREYNIPGYTGMFPMERMGRIGTDINREFRKAAESIVAAINRIPETVQSNSAKSVTMITSEIKELQEAIRRSDVFREAPDAVEPTVKYINLYMTNLLYTKLISNVQVAISEENDKILRANVGKELYREFEFYEHVIGMYKGDKMAEFQKYLNYILEDMREHGFQVKKRDYGKVGQKIIDWFQQEERHQKFATLAELLERKEELDKHTSKKLKEAFFTFLSIIIPFGFFAGIIEYLFGRPPPPPPPAPVFYIGGPPGGPPPMLQGYPPGAYPMLPGYAPPGGVPGQIGWPGYPPQQAWPQLAAPLPAQGAPIALPNAGPAAGQLALVPPAAPNGLRQRPAGRPRAGSVGAGARQQVLVAGPGGVLRLANGVLGGARTLKRAQRQRRRTRRST